MRTPNLGLVTILVLLVMAPRGFQVRGATPDDLQTRELAATPLEAFAANPGAVIVWASPVGRVESAASRAIVTAVAIADRRSMGIMRGLRIDLVHLQPPSSCNKRFVSHAVLCARANASVYFEEDILGRVRDGVARGNAEQNLIISYSQSRLGERTTGLIIGGYTFEGRQPPELTALVERGSLELKSAPR